MNKTALTPYPQRNKFCLLLAITSGVIALCFSSITVAYPTVGDHLQNFSKADYQASMNIWCDGAIGAFLSVNTVLKERKEPSLFCLPKGQGISSADAMKLIDQGVASRRWKDVVPLDIVLLDGLQKSYPCN